MNPIRTLVIDDSVVFRSQIRSALEGIAGVEVVGVAATGNIGLRKLIEGNIDLVILDLEMPEMSGLELLAAMRERSLFPKVIVFSSYSTRGAEATLDALRLGACDFVSKPNGDTYDGEVKEPKEIIRQLLKEKIVNLFTEELKPKNSSLDSGIIKPIPQSPIVTDWSRFRPEVIVIGSSTGGPNALEEIFLKISVPLSCPILLVQHMPPVFTASLAERLGKIAKIPAAEAKEGELLTPNQIYVAPGDFHMRLFEYKVGVGISLDQGPKEQSVRPAVDPLFISAAKIFKDKCLAVILTGMGEDGLIGAHAVRSNGGKVMIQDEKSCVVFGMPGAAYHANAYDKIGDLQSIAETINNCSHVLKRGVHV